MSKRRELIVLSDGTGNSASKSFKTNVWRLYQALNLRDGSQVAVFGDGVGNSGVTLLRVIGLALGFGVKRNALNLYKFLCHNYRGGEQPDRIWMFGFSRGAFTIRVLAGMIDSQGLVTFRTESELNQNAIAAYRAFRAKAFKTKLPWVRAARWCRDTAIYYWRKSTGGTQYSEVVRRSPRIHFIGVWDTVAAYGLPIDELTIACDNWVWPMQFHKRDLLPSVDHARQAMGLDDERRTFHPIPWSEDDEKDLQSDRKKCEQLKVTANRLLQVWFPGMHSDVGGGYPDDGLSLVPLCWMIDEAHAKGLRFEEDIVKIYRAQASPTGRLNDSRAGFGILWRYQPRNVQFLMDDRRDKILPADRTTPLVHHSAITRMSFGNDGYAPISLPLNINILLPNVTGVPLPANATVRFNKDSIDAALKNPKDEETKAVLSNLATLIVRKDGYDSSDYFDLVADTVWLRRCTYFLTLGLALVALALPLIYQALGWDDNSAKANQIASGTLSYFAGLFKGMLPSFATPWIDAATSSGTWAIAIVVAFLLSLALSSFLQLRIYDRARGAWNVQPDTGGTGDGMNRLKLSGQRRGLAAMTFIFAGATLASLAVVDEHSYRWIAVAIFLLAFVVCAASWRYRLKHPEDDVHPSHPRWALRWARRIRKNPDYVRLYRRVAQTIAPAFFFTIVALLVIGGLNLTLFNIQSTMGNFCKAPKVDYAEPVKTQIATGRYEKPGVATDIPLTQLCASTGLWLVAGREYRIQVEQQEPWFDSSWPADVTGFKAGWFHTPFTPLKRWWTKDWFQPVVRVGNVGNYEYPLVPTSPLPKVDFSKVHPGSAPLTKEAAAALVKLEQDKGVVRNKVLIADIVPKSSGELYFYVNDAIVGLSPFIQGWFYRNNIGKAKITVTRTTAPATIDFKQE